MAKASFVDGLSIEALIDRELAVNARLDNAYAAYAGMLDTFRRTGNARKLLRSLLDHCAAGYRAAAGPGSELVTFDDGAAGFLFDITRARTVLVWGASRSAAANSRDDAYHNGFPRAGDGLDKGHAWSHAQGGREGGPNYFRQNRGLNQGKTRSGKLWRAIETYLAANAGTRAFIRLLYKAGDTSDTPGEIEYGLLGDRAQFRVVRFPNS